MKAVLSLVSTYVLQLLPSSSEVSEKLTFLGLSQLPCYYYSPFSYFDLPMGLETEVCRVIKTSHSYTFIVECSLIQSVPFKNFINQFFLAMQLNQLACFLFFFLITVRVSAEWCVQGLSVKSTGRLVNLMAAQLMTNAYASWQSKCSAHTKKCKLHTTSVSFSPLAEPLS